MPTVETMATLDNLSKLSQELNAKSNEINKILLDLEKKLQALNLGLEAWGDAIGMSSDALVTKRNEEDGSVVNEVLGFGRHGDRYALLVKTETWTEDEGHEIVSWESEGEPRLLLQTSREVRIKALSLIDQLLAALEEEARTVIKAIEDGRKAVDGIKSIETQ
jgi:hypothetical protein